MTQPMLLELPSPLPPPARLGEMLGKYRLERIVAEGGMGVVVEATHVHLDQRVAIKFLSPLLAGDEMSVQRFLQEARAAAQIRSEHVVRVFDVDTLSTGTPYIVMELLEGEDLNTTLERRGRLPPSEAVDFVLQACHAIAEAHSVGIVHRDLKPGNLFACQRADRQPFIKVLDFGVSKLLPSARGWRERASTGPHVVMGTPLYASPEQLYASTRVDARADIWALGIILYELIAGNPPFEGDTLFELRTKISGAAPRPLHELRREVSRELGAVVARCLAKDAHNRFATVGDLVDALAPHAPRSSVPPVTRIEQHAGTPRPLEPTLPSVRGPSAGLLRRTIAATKRSATPGRGLRITLRTVTAGILGGALIGAIMAWVPRLESGGAATLAATSAAPASVTVPPAPSSTSSAAEEPAPEEAAAPAPEAPATASATRPSPSRPRHAPGTERFGGLL
ncbi:MAG TPA: serine/threonine-protein kinase [Polyangiaceae bacterium]